MFSSGPRPSDKGGRGGGGGGGPVSKKRKNAIAM